MDAVRAQGLAILSTVLCGCSESSGIGHIIDCALWMQRELRDWPYYLLCFVDAVRAQGLAILSTVLCGCSESSGIGHIIYCALWMQ